MLPSRAAIVIMPPNDIRRVRDVKATTIDEQVFAAAISAAPLIVIDVPDEKNPRFCSGLLVAGKAKGKSPRILTVASCFSKKEKAKEAVSITPMADACANTTVYFKQQEIEDTSTVVKLARRCQPGSLRTSTAASLAVFSLDAALPPDYPVTELWDDDGDITGRQVFAIHYPSAPNANVGKVSIKDTDMLVPSQSLTDNCTIGGRIPERILNATQMQPHRHLFAYSIIHNCDFTEGSYGAGLLDVSTGKLLAVESIGLFLGGGDGTTLAFNTAVHVKYVRQFLAGTAIKP